MQCCVLLIIFRLLKLGWFCVIQTKVLFYIMLNFEVSAQPLSDEIKAVNELNIQDQKFFIMSSSLC